MTDAVSMTPELPKFTTVKYTTKDGENVTATKKDGIVTLVGDKNGTRELPLDEFLTKELPENVQNVKLEKTPTADTVEILKPATPETTTNTEIKPTTPEITKEQSETQKPEIGQKLDVQV